MWAEVSSKLNCEVLWDDLAYEVRWAVAGDSIVLQLVARLENGEYMSFGISGDDSKSRMVGGDVTVVWVDKDTLKGHAQDYYLDAKSQCSGARGSCPDENIAEKSNSVRLLNAALVNGYSIVTFQRSLKAQDELDKPIYVNGSQPIIWAIGPLNARREVSYHSIANRADILLDFGRPPKWNCPTPETQGIPSQQSEPDIPPRQKQPAGVDITQDNRQQSSNRRESSKPKAPTATPAPVAKVKPWDIPAIQCYEPEDGVFYAQMGPTGGKRGYSAITGHVGWGISWYINGLLIPEINVVRGRTYTFIVEGGLDPETPARYHPFYITDDPVGGYEYKTPQERAQVQIFAGAVQNKKGEVRPTGVGRLCNWTPDQNQPQADEFASFGAYQRTLRLECDQGEPGIVQWTVAKETPDTVYYQCYTHRYLGWKINVLDDCEQGAGSDSHPFFAKPPQIDQLEPAAEASIQHETKIKPDINANRISSLSSNLFESTKTLPTVTYVPEYHFYNEDTGEPLDEETVHAMNLEKEIQKLQSQFYKLETNTPTQAQVKPQSQVINFNNDDQFLKFFHTPKPSYSVQEHLGEGSATLPTSQFQHTSQTERPSYVPTTNSKPIQYESTTDEDEKFNQEFLKNYLQLQAEMAEKLKIHNQKQQYSFGKPTRLQYSAPRRPTSPHHAFTLQQRPLPPGMFRPPFLPPPNKSFSKRPAGPATAGSQKIPTYANPNSIPNRPNNYIRPHKPQRNPEIPHILLASNLPTSQAPPVNVQQVLALQKLLSTILPHHTILSTTPAYAEQSAVSTTQATPLAINTGFNPSSVKVEGGFKPILNSGISPNLKIANERMDDMVDEDDVQDDIGVIDLTKQHQQQQLQEHIETTTEKKRETNNVTVEGEDIFKHLKPLMFEPMFVPSPPDHRIQKNSPKYYKKKQSNPKYEAIKNRNNHLEPYNGHKNKYIKMRPRPALIRRPLYPNNVMPPFQIPLRGGSPQFRYQQDDESVEDTTDFDIIQMNNDSISVEDEKAENIFEVMEKQTEDNSTKPGKMEIVVINKEDGEIFDNEFNLKNETEDEIAMADERRDFYLPPDSASGTITYDGKLVSAIAAPSLPDKTPRFDISKLPQFAPFRGDLPSFSESLSIADLPQVRESTAARGDILPPSSPLVRRERSPDHIPGHVGDDHEHEHHDHADVEKSNNAVVSGQACLIIIIPILSIIRVL